MRSILIIKSTYKSIWIQKNKSTFLWPNYKERYSKKGKKTRV